MDGCLLNCSYIPSVKRFASDWRDLSPGFFYCRRFTPFGAGRIDGLVLFLSSRGEHLGVFTFLRIPILLS